VRIIATRRSDQNHAAIDPWTAVHISAGLALGLMDTPRSWSLAAALGYELAEQYFERTELGKDLFETRGPESIGNAIVDTAAFMAGHWLGTLWLRR
jgi:hypothetical protein